jgi:hypothetical protein
MGVGVDFDLREGWMDATTPVALRFAGSLDCSEGHMKKNSLSVCGFCVRVKGQRSKEH